MRETDRRQDSMTIVDTDHCQDSLTMVEIDLGPEPLKEDKAASLQYIVWKGQDIVTTDETGLGKALGTTEKTVQGQALGIADKTCQGQAKGTADYIV